MNFKNLLFLTLVASSAVMSAFDPVMEEQVHEDIVQNDEKALEMEQTTTSLPIIKLVGITARTSNSNEMNPETAKIGATIQKYFHDQVPNAIVNRKNPGVTYCMYTEYESNMHGDYTYFIGEEVDSFEGLAGDLVKLVVPASYYAKFTTAPGVMPTVCINAWQKIWQMTPEELGGERAYVADFEVYDHRAMNPNNTVLDIYIGIK